MTTGVMTVDNVLEDQPPLGAMVFSMPPINLFCDRANLHNEADVEQNFARRLIEGLGYDDAQIRPKESLTKLVVGRARGRPENYRPDFAMKLGRHIRWIFEAKSPTQNLDEHVWQPRGYCVILNGQFEAQNPVEFFVLSNGIRTRLYRWDYTDPLLDMDFTDFHEDNSKYSEFVEYLSPSGMARTPVPTVSAGPTHRLEKRSISDVNAAFAWCHQHIYKKDAISQSAAFTEFVKVVFLKLLSDKAVRDKYPEVVAEDVFYVPQEDVRFTLRWLTEHERDTANPLDTIQFQNLIAEMEREIRTGRRKRIFESNERIRLSPDTIHGVVARLEHIFLFGIDVDLNGRLFETFLNATMRGKDLGQYFTPRSIVKLGTKLARIAVHVPSRSGGWHTDRVIDACCGTGGFLIEALADMWAKVDSNSSLDDAAKRELKQKIADEYIYGIDVGRDPHMARIARINMYLHGDGGSSIFQADILNKGLPDGPTDSPELLSERAELRSLLRPEGLADVVLTNPPFAKSYDRVTQDEARVLDEYEIGASESGEFRPSLKSSLMFLERYHNILQSAGRMVTVIDDGILGGRDYGWFRSYIRNKYIIRAVISLPGDAFQRSKARVKTSLLIVEKRRTDTDEQGNQIHQVQPDVFMYACRYVGIDDPARQRTLPIDQVNRDRANEEISNVSEEFANFLAGNCSPEFSVAASRIENRLDVKSCLKAPGRKVDQWEESGFQVVELGDIAELRQFKDEDEDTILTPECDDFVTYLRVRYDGFAEMGDEIIASDTGYSRLYRVHTNDLVTSNIAASYGSTAIVPEELDSCVITSEFTVFRARTGIDPRVVWLMLRSPVVRADILLMSTGIARTRIRWEDMSRIRLPMPTSDISVEILELLIAAEVAETQSWSPFVGQLGGVR